MSDEALDKEGFLLDLATWNRGLAEQIAAREHVQMTDGHWSVIKVLREFYHETGISPAMRPFVKLIRTRVSVPLGSSIELMKMFGPSPAKTAAKIAGLPKPPNCD